jgi:hypothetical protein
VQAIEPGLAVVKEIAERRDGKVYPFKPSSIDAGTCSSDI